MPWGAQRLMDWIPILFLEPHSLQIFHSCYINHYMKSTIKQLVKVIVSGSVKYLTRGRLGAYILELILNSAMGATQNVSHNGLTLSFYTPNQLNRYRVDSFSSKEPETLNWIDTMTKGSVFWDVGANIGLYSCYAAKRRGLRVFAFEPSVFNLEYLARNIFLNQLVDQVVIVPLPLSDTIKISTLNMTTTEWGGALSTFGENYGDDGKNLEKVFNFSSVSLSMDEAVALFKIPLPTHIKIDVDGIEHLILSGGQSILQHVEEVAIEVNESFSHQVSSVQKYLSAAGLTFREKKHSAMFDNSERWGRTYNQVWHRVN